MNKNIVAVLAQRTLLWLRIFCALWPVGVNGRELSRDEFFVVASKNALGLTSFDAPSINDDGDIVLRATTSSSTQHRVFFPRPNAAQSDPHKYVDFVVREVPITLSRFPMISNGNNTPGSEYPKSIVSHYSFTGGNQNIREPLLTPIC